jgi:hypothetical protein
MSLKSEPRDEQCRLRAGVLQRKRTNLLRLESRNRGHALERVCGQPLPVLLEPERVRPDERRVVQAGVNDDTRHA